MPRKTLSDEKIGRIVSISSKLTDIQNIMSEISSLCMNPNKNTQMNLDSIDGTQLMFRFISSRRDVLIKSKSQARIIKILACDFYYDLEATKNSNLFNVETTLKNMLKQSGEYDNVFSEVLKILDNRFGVHYPLDQEDINLLLNWVDRWEYPLSLNMEMVSATHLANCLTLIRKKHVQSRTEQLQYNDYSMLDGSTILFSLMKDEYFSSYKSKKHFVDLLIDKLWIDVNKEFQYSQQNFTFYSMYATVYKQTPPEKLKPIEGIRCSRSEAKYPGKEGSSAGSKSPRDQYSGVPPSNQSANTFFKKESPKDKKPEENKSSVRFREKLQFPSTPTQEGKKLACEVLGVLPDIPFVSFHFIVKGLLIGFHPDKGDKTKYTEEELNIATQNINNAHDYLKSCHEQEEQPLYPRPGR